MKRSIAVAVAAVWLLSGTLASAQKDEAKEQAELAKALGAAKISLQGGLSASARAGTPISAKYEVEEGKLQLSVYIMKGAEFSEVIVDHATGKVAKSEAITKTRSGREGEQGIPGGECHAGPQGWPPGGRGDARQGHRVQGGV